MSMYAIFVLLVKLVVCQKQKQVVPYHEYDVDEVNDGHDPGGKYDSECDTMSLFDLSDVSAAFSMRNRR
jgi:hypothetical protein